MMARKITPWKEEPIPLELEEMNARLTREQQAAIRKLAAALAKCQSQKLTLLSSIYDALTIINVSWMQEPAIGAEYLELDSFIRYAWQLMQEEKEKAKWLVEET